MAHSETRLYSAWDIVVVPFPYTDRLAEKRRPALVISNRVLARHGVIWTAMITSAENPPWATDVAIPDFERAGLPAPSVVRPAKVACIDPARVLARAGRLDGKPAVLVAQRIAGFLGKA